MISSMAGQIGFAGTGAYCASKFALEGMSEALAEELAPFGVRVLIVEPGAFRTDFSGRSIRGADASVDAYASEDRKSTRLNSSNSSATGMTYACRKIKNKN